MVTFAQNVTYNAEATTTDETGETEADATKATGAVSAWDTNQMRAYCALNGIDVSACTTDGEIIDAIGAAGNVLPMEPEKA